MIQHELIFDTPERAGIFVKRLFLALHDVASFRDGVRVLVWDGHEPPQTEAIQRLAKSSSASWRRWTPRGGGG